MTAAEEVAEQMEVGAVAREETVAMREVMVVALAAAVSEREDISQKLQ